MRKVSLICCLSAILLVPISVTTSQPAQAQASVAARCAKWVVQQVGAVIAQRCIAWVYDHRQQFRQPLPPTLWKPGFVGPPQPWQPYYFRRR